MPPVQTTYSERHANGLLGQVVNMETSDSITGICQEAAGIPFGAAVVRGTTDQGVLLPDGFVYVGAGAAAAGNTGAATITTTPPVVAPAKVGVYTLTALTSGPTAEFEMEDPNGVKVGTVVTGTPATIDGIGPFTITDAGTDPAVGDGFTITVTSSAGGGAFRGITVRDITLVRTSTQTVDLYQRYENMGLHIGGSPIWVLAGATVTRDEKAYYIPATNKWTNVAGSNYDPGNAYFETGGTDGTLVQLRVNKI